MASPTWPPANSHGHEAELARLRARQTALEAEVLRLRAATRDSYANDILESMGEAFIALDSGFRVTQINRKALELDGRKRPEILGRSHWEVWPDSVSTPVEAAYRRCMTERVPVALEHRYERDGRETWQEIRAYPAPAGIAVFYRDINDRKQVEQTLNNRARRLEILSRTAAQLLDAREPGGILEPLHHSLPEELGIDSSFSFVLEDGVLTLTSWFGMPEALRRELARIKLSESSVCTHVARTGRAVHATEIQSSTDPMFGFVRRYGLRAYACFPLLAPGGRLLGTLSFGTRQRDRFSEADISFLGTLAQQAAAVWERLRTEAELRQQSALLATITDNAAEALFLMDREGCITFANRAAEQMLGWQQREMQGSVLYDLLLRDQRRGQPPANGGSAIRCAVARGEVLRWHEETVFRKDGSTLDVSCSSAPIMADGRADGAVLVMHDITARKQAEWALAESQARVRQLAELSPAIIWFGHRDGTLSYLNRAWYEYTGLTPRESLPDGWQQVLHPDDAPTLMAAWEKARCEGGFYDTECRFRRHDGAYRWFQIRGMPLHDPDGTITGWLGNDTDIHDLRTAEEALLRLNEELERRVADRTADLDRMWRLSTDIMLVARFDATMTAVNPAWQSTLGWNEAELLGRNFMELVHPDDHEATLGAIGRLEEGHRVLRFENRYRHKDGSYRWLSWTGVPDESFIHAVARDVTAEKAAAEELARAQEQLRQAQKMEAVGQLTGGLAHDFNNLLTGIIGSVALLRTRIAQGRAGEVGRYLNAAQQSAERAASLTQRLLAFSRRQTLDPKATDVAKLCASLEDLIRRTVGPEIEVRCEMPEDLWTTFCDPHQLENALLNLAINSRDAMPDGGQLTISAVNKAVGDPRAARRRGLAPGDYVMITVSDSGTGMPREVLERVFEPFFTTKPLGQGTGLGLSMVYGFAQQSGGHVLIDSEVGRGTDVCIYLPRGHGEVAAEADAEPGKTQGVCAVSETVVLVDDEPVVRMLATEVLREHGYQTLAAVDGREGLRILNSDRRVDLLVTDVGLPGGMNGRQLADAARQRRPGLKVLFITGYAEAAAIGKDTLEPGMQVITKPFAMDMLAARVRSMIATP